MSTTISDLCHYANAALQINQFKDYCPNGLQVQGKNDISTLISGVSLCLPLIQSAIDQQADVIMVHHGLLWKADPLNIIGLKYQRLNMLMHHQINLLAYHLPLDVHHEWGNNAQMLLALGACVKTCHQALACQHLLMMGEFAEAVEACELAVRIDHLLGREPMIIVGNDRPISQIACITGSGGDGMVEAASHGADAFVTGELAERHYHMAKELGITIFAAGHHATERFGVQTFGQHLADRFDLQHQFVDIDNPL